MNIIYLLIPLAFLLSGSALALYIWCSRSGQYEDLDTPAHRMMIDD